jgi:mono/diheme cytochrome c family protein
MKKRNQLSQFALATRWLAAPFIAAPWLAAPLLGACGADDGILLAEILQQAQNGNGTPNRPPSEPEPQTPTPAEPPVPENVDQQAIEAMLLTYCGSCHQASDDPNQPSGGFDDVGSIDAIVERGLIVPSSPQQSYLLLRMQDGSMPPSLVEPRPSAEEIEQLESFIDSMPIDPLELAAIWRANAARNVLGTFCSSCHGSDVALGDLGNVTDLDALVLDGQIVPGSALASPIYVRMQQGSMPPNSTPDRPSAEDLELIEDYIEALD